MEILVVVLVGVAAIVAVLYPLLRGEPGQGDMEPVPVSSANAPAVDDIEADIARYRAALHDETVCARCLQANPAGSKYCFECGRKLGEAPALPGEGDM